MLPSRAQNPRQNSRRGEQAGQARRNASRRSKCAATGPRGTPRAATNRRQGGGGHTRTAGPRRRYQEGRQSNRRRQRHSSAKAAMASLTGLGAHPGGQARAAKHFRRTSGLCSRCTELYPVPWQRRRQSPYPTQLRRRHPIKRSGNRRSAPQDAGCCALMAVAEFRKRPSSPPSGSGFRPSTDRRRFEPMFISPAEPSRFNRREQASAVATGSRPPASLS